MVSIRLRPTMASAETGEELAKLGFLRPPLLPGPMLLKREVVPFFKQARRQ